MKDGNVRFSMKKKGQYTRIAFSVKITQIFILSYLTTLLNCISVSLFRTLVLYSVIV